MMFCRLVGSFLYLVKRTVFILENVSFEKSETGVYKESAQYTRRPESPETPLTEGHISESEKHLGRDY
jgi:hypothetical protein